MFVCLIKYQAVEINGEVGVELKAFFVVKGPAADATDAPQL